ncbi:MAG TPA: PilN domain-containing protein [Desulfomonilaceae bacterium]|nr:PilN domain-containing protein [Desulfomonilaceae bacterium]
MVRINLLPIREILRKRELKQFLFLSAVILAAALGLMAFTYLFFTWKVADLENQKRVRQAELESLKKQNQEIEDLKNRIDRLNRQVDTIQKLTQRRDTPAPFMAAISLAMPEEVWLTSISKTGKGFSLDGIGVDNTVVINFVQNLQKVKQGFTEKQPWLDPGNPNDKPFFNDVKLVQIVTAGTGPGSLAAMNFKIVGSLR